MLSSRHYRRRRHYCYTFIINLFYLSSIIQIIAGEFGRLVIEPEESTGHHYPASAESKETLQSRSYYRVPCTGPSECVPLAECSQIFYEAAKTCYSGDRSLLCGISDFETYVCCPRSANNLQSSCGKSLVQGPYYKGLGAFPFVARIGFKSEFRT